MAWKRRIFIVICCTVLISILFFLHKSTITPKLIKVIKSSNIRMSITAKKTTNIPKIINAQSKYQNDKKRQPTSWFMSLLSWTFGDDPCNCDTNNTKKYIADAEDLENRKLTFGVNPTESQLVLPSNITYFIEYDLKSIKYDPHVVNRNGLVHLRSSKFVSTMSLDEKRRMSELLDATFDALEATNSTYFIYGGTLLGSYRYHDLLPYDDDIDVMMHPDHVAGLTDYLDSQHHLGLAYGHQHGQGILKVYQRDSANCFKAYGYCWPFVDIFHWVENQYAAIYDADFAFTPRYIRKAVIFPLVWRPLGRRTVPAPCDIHEFLSAWYDDFDICASPWWDHKHEDMRRGSTILPCSHVNRVHGYPDIVRQRLPAGGVRETMRVRGTTIGSVIVGTCEYPWA